MPIDLNAELSVNKSEKSVTISLADAGHEAAARAAHAAYNAALPVLEGEQASDHPDYIAHWLDYVAYVYGHALESWKSKHGIA